MNGRWWWLNFVQICADVSEGRICCCCGWLLEMLMRSRGWGWNRPPNEHNCGSNGAARFYNSSQFARFIHPFGNVWFAGLHSNSSVSRVAVVYVPPVAHAHLRSIHASAATRLLHLKLQLDECWICHPAEFLIKPNIQQISEIGTLFFLPNWHDRYLNSVCSNESIF